MTGALAEFWAVRGHLTEGRRRIEGALGADDGPTAARAKALNGAADLATGTGDPETAMRRAREGLALNRELGRGWGIADSLLLLGIAHNESGDFSQGKELIEESIPLYRELGDAHGVMEASRLLAWSCGQLGDRARAKELLEDTIRRARALGDTSIESRSLASLGSHATDEGRGADALRLLAEAYRLGQQLGDAYMTPITVCRMGGALAVDGMPALAATVLSAGEALLEEIGAGGAPWISEMNGASCDQIRAQLDEEAFAAAWVAGKGLTADEAVALALDHSG